MLSLSDHRVSKNILIHTIHGLRSATNFPRQMKRYILQQLSNGGVSWVFWDPFSRCFGGRSCRNRRNPKEPSLDVVARAERLFFQVPASHEPGLIHFRVENPNFPPTKSIVFRVEKVSRFANSRNNNLGAPSMIKRDHLGTIFFFFLDRFSFRLQLITARGRTHQGSGPLKIEPPSLPPPIPMSLWTRFECVRSPNEITSSNVVVISSNDRGDPASERSTKWGIGPRVCSCYCNSQNWRKSWTRRPSILKQASQLFIQMIKSRLLPSKAATVDSHQKDYKLRLVTVCTDKGNLTVALHKL